MLIGRHALMLGNEKFQIWYYRIIVSSYILLLKARQLYLIIGLIS